MRWRRTVPGTALAVLTSAVLLGACSSEDEGGAAAPTPSPGAGKEEKTSEKGAKNQAQACTTKPRVFDVAPRDYYHVYASEADAVASMRAVVPSIPWADPGSDLQRRGQAAVAKIFAAYQKLYPESVEGMEAPRVLISNSLDFNAFAFVLPFLPETSGPKRVPWIFVYNQGFFTPTITDEQITLVAAHEMGHLFLRNGNPEFFTPVYYRETPDEQGKIFGEYETTEEDVKNLTLGVKAIGERVGQVSLAELHGVPTTIGADALPGGTSFQFPLYHRILIRLVQLGAENSPERDKCNSGGDAYDKVTRLIGEHTTADNEVVFGADLAELETAAKTANTDLAACLAHLTGTFRDAAVELKKVEDPNFETTTAELTTEAELDEYLGLSQNEKNADATNPDQNLVTKLFDLGAKAQEALRAVYTDGTVKYEEFREFTMEDDADEAAVRIAKVMGLDGDQLAGGIFTALDPGYVASCKTVLDGGKVPKYGGAIDPHHGNCWRAYRNRKLKIALQSCPASWPK